MVAEFLNFLVVFFCFRYIEKFTEFLRLFVSVHLRRVEANLHFPVIEFMSLLLKYTIRQVNTL